MDRDSRRRVMGEPSEEIAGHLCGVIFRTKDYCMASLYVVR
jgi:hypothetical protein